MDITKICAALGVSAKQLKNGDLAVTTPIDGSEIARVHVHTDAQADEKINLAHEAFLVWRTVPAPKRGELIRVLGQVLRDHKEDLGKLVSIECGKIYQEGLGEVQEMIDICDFAVGLSRQLYGLTIASERPGHRMMETWHPLGVTGVISAFNFPVAVWAWNFALAVVCGNSVVWKPSEKTPVTALACQALFEKAVAQCDVDVPENLSSLIMGDKTVGEVMVDHPLVPLISATGSTRMGHAVGPRVAQRFGRTILELGGNNAMIVTPSADLKLAERAILFSAVGTCGQRCTTLRRLIVHEDVVKKLLPRIKKSYASITIGDPLDQKNLIGPLIDEQAKESMQQVLDKARKAGAVITGGQMLDGDGAYVTPAIVEVDEQKDFVKQETFVPILYVMTYKNFDDALNLHNDVPQGLSSCIFTNDVREAEMFLSAAGSDCGIANVNIGPSGAEIGGAFGGEKETGGGRESGSDSWKAYMRRQTNTINYSTDLPLAQGITFGS